MRVDFIRLWNVATQQRALSSGKGCFDIKQLYPAEDAPPNTTPSRSSLLKFLQEYMRGSKMEVRGIACRVLGRCQELDIDQKKYCREQLLQNFVTKFCR